MAYSRSEQTLKLILPELSGVISGRTQKWDVTPGRAWWKAGKIREAFYIAREVYPHKYPELARISRSFTVEVLDDHTVQARPTSNTPALSDDWGQTGTGFTPLPPLSPTHGLEPEGQVPRTIVGMKTATDIISWCLRAFPTNDKLVFTETQLDEMELSMLSRWASAQTPRWMVVVSADVGIVTLAPWQPGVPVWAPRA